MQHVNKTDACHHQTIQTRKSNSANYVVQTWLIVFPLCKIVSILCKKNPDQHRTPQIPFNLIPITAINFYNVPISAPDSLLPHGKIPFVCVLRLTFNKTIQHTMDSPFSPILLLSGKQINWQNSSIYTPYSTRAEQKNYCQSNNYIDTIKAN